jgi:hypothetical protein
MSPRARQACLEACAAHGVHLGWVFSGSRRRVVARARWACWAALYALRRPNGAKAFSTTAIGRLFGMDHSSVVIGLRRHAEGLAKADETRKAAA